MQELKQTIGTAQVALKRIFDTHFRRYEKAEIQP